MLLILLESDGGNIIINQGLIGALWFLCKCIVDEGALLNTKLYKVEAPIMNT